MSIPIRCDCEWTEHRADTDWIGLFVIAFYTVLDQHTEKMTENRRAGGEKKPFGHNVECSHSKTWMDSLSPLKVCHFFGYVVECLCMCVCTSSQRSETVHEIWNVAKPSERLLLHSNVQNEEIFCAKAHTSYLIPIVSMLHLGQIHEALPITTEIAKKKTKSKMTIFCNLHILNTYFNNGSRSFIERYTILLTEYCD